VLHCIIHPYLRMHLPHTSNSRHFFLPPISRCSSPHIMSFDFCVAVCCSALHYMIYLYLWTHLQHTSNSRHHFVTAISCCYSSHNMCSLFCVAVTWHVAVRYTILFTYIYVPHTSNSRHYSSVVSHAALPHTLCDSSFVLRYVAVRYTI